MEDKNNEDVCRICSGELEYQRINKDCPFCDNKMGERGVACSCDCHGGGLFKGFLDCTEQENGLGASVGDSYFPEVEREWVGKGIIILCVGIVVGILLTLI